MIRRIRWIQGDLEVIPDRYTTGNPTQLTPKAVYSYIPIIPRLKLLYSNPTYAKKMRYPSAELWNKPWTGVRDLWDGDALQYFRLEEGAAFFVLS